jgi:hypothetical protein
MNSIGRRNFLKISGALGAVALLPLVRWFPDRTPDGILTFRGMTGLPQLPLPAFASYVLQGSVDLNSGVGTLAQNLLAGAPGFTSDIALPGHERTIRVFGVQPVDGGLLIRGAVDDPSGRQSGKSLSMDIRLDALGRRATTTFMGSAVDLQLSELALIA